jgi:hypothetical protein
MTVADKEKMKFSVCSEEALGVILGPLEERYGRKLSPEKKEKLREILKKGLSNIDNISSMIDFEA